MKNDDYRYRATGIGGRGGVHSTPAYTVSIHELQICQGIPRVRGLVIHRARSSFLRYVHKFIARIRCVPQRSEERTDTMRPGAGRDFVAARPCVQGLVATLSLLASGAYHSAARNAPTAMQPGAQRKLSP